MKFNILLLSEKKNLEKLRYLVHFGSTFNIRFFGGNSLNKIPCVATVLWYIQEILIYQQYISVIDILKLLNQKRINGSVGGLEEE